LSEGRGRARALVSAAGGLLVAVGLGSEWIVAGAPGLGPLQWLMVGAGAGLLPFGLLTGAWLRGYAAAASMAVSTYLVLFLFDLALDLRAGPPRNGMASVRGMVRPAAWGGFELTPGWHGTYDDGWAKTVVAINASGDRDGEADQQPRTARTRAILLGDSQAFGTGLPREDTIESQIEQLSQGDAAAYNLGVPGYGPGDSLEHYRERGELRASHTFFLLYANDVRFENCRTAYSTAYQGYIVPRERADGLRLSPEELERALAGVESLGRRTVLERLKSSLLLVGLRRRVEALFDPEQMLRPGRPGDFSAECSREAARNVDAMRTLAEERGQRFAVVILPTPGEVRLQRYSKPMQDCLDELKRRAVPIIEVKELLSPEDYLEGDEHLSRAGAGKVAGAIVRSFEG
jgi:hypothetical protein